MTRFACGNAVTRIQFLQEVNIKKVQLSNITLCTANLSVVNNTASSRVIMTAVLWLYF